MKVKNNNITITRGDSEGIKLTFKNYELTEEDLIELTVRENLRSPIVIHKEAELMSDGTALITIQPEDTSKLDFGEYVYDVQITFVSGSVKTVVGPSKFFIGGEVTYE